MPQRKSAKDELKKSKVRRLRNIDRKKKLKEVLKTFKRSLEAGDIDASQAALHTVYKTLDRSASKKIIHANKASRKKSRLTAQLNKLKTAGSK